MWVFWDMPLCRTEQNEGLLGGTLGFRVGTLLEKHTGEGPSS